MGPKGAGGSETHNGEFTLEMIMPNNPEPIPKIFISYAWKNQTIAKRLQGDLKRDGVEVFVDYEKIYGGDSLPAHISVGLEWCNTLVLLWSADSAESYYVQKEWTSAFHLQKRIITCVLDGTKLPALLSGNLYLNFTPYETDYTQLCRSHGVEPIVSAEKTAPPEAPTSKLPPQYVEMPVPQPPEERLESLPPKRKPVSGPFRRKPEFPEPTPVLRPPEVFDDTKDDDTITAEMTAPARRSRRKIMSAALALIIVAAVFFTRQLVCQSPTKPISQQIEPEQKAPAENKQPFRDKPATLSDEEVKTMLAKYGFYDRDWNKNGKGLAHRYKPDTIAYDKVVHDEASGLTWEQSGSQNGMTFADAEKYVRDLNAKNFAGHNDWHMPTLEEAMSLVEPKEPDGVLYIDLLFDRQQSFIWTADKRRADVAWVAFFYAGKCSYYGF